MNDKNENQWVDHVMGQVEWLEPSDDLRQRIMNAIDSKVIEPAFRLPFVTSPTFLRTGVLVVTVLAGFFTGVWMIPTKETRTVRSYSLPVYSGVGMMMAQNYMLSDGGAYDE